ncbi:MAG: CBS domain-containing protein [Desulfobacteraceae bacterium]|nr:CBS domain-containing protein [Desulfobacteraceae bacterium]
MKRRIRELMARISELAVVDAESSVFEAILEIGIVKHLYNGGLKWPTVLVLDQEQKVIGFVDFRSMLKDLQPQFSYFARGGETNGHSSGDSGASESASLLDGLDDLCRRASETPIRSAMAIAEGGVTIDADASIAEAIIQMTTLGRDYLFVREGDALTGIIGLNDIMTHLCERVRACRV